ncbi:MAG: cytochrome P450, partial [Polyangiaceae bacterium]|nr:cytochrome P450 [Polyangiaceae bacterium]
ADLASTLAGSLEERDPMLGKLAEAISALVIGTLATGRHLTSHTLLALLSHRAASRQLTADPRLARAAVEEASRLSGPTLGVFRRASEEVIIAGERLRAGERLCCMVHAANRDPEVFEAPALFDIARRPRPLPGFGSSTPGDGLVHLFAEAAAAAIAPLLPRLHLTGSAPRVGAIALRGLSRLPVQHRFPLRDEWRYPEADSPATSRA